MKAILIISALILSENVGGIKLKPGQEIKQRLIDQKLSHLGEIFSSLALTPL